MIAQRISEKIDVLFKDNPYLVYWKGRRYKIDKIGLHHFFYEGKTLYHVYSATSGNLFLRLKLDTFNLSWILEEIYES